MRERRGGGGGKVGRERYESVPCCIQATIPAECPQYASPSHILSLHGCQRGIFTNKIPEGYAPTNGSYYNQCNGNNLYHKINSKFSGRFKMAMWGSNRRNHNQHVLYSEFSEFSLNDQTRADKQHDDKKQSIVHPEYQGRSRRRTGVKGVGSRVIDQHWGGGGLFC